MDLYEAIEIICDDYCKYPDVYSGNQLADKCDMCPFNKCEELRWADRKTENSSEKPNNFDKDINVRSKTENSSEIPNNCETCKHWEYDAKYRWWHCPLHDNGMYECHYEPRKLTVVEDDPQTDNGIGCSRCEGRYDCYDRDMPHAVHCNNYGKITDEPRTERSSDD